MVINDKIYDMFDDYIEIDPNILLRIKKIQKIKQKIIENNITTSNICTTIK